MPAQTTHPSPEELNAFSLGQLPPEEAAVIESHISECQPCCATMLGLSSDDTFVGLLKEAKQLPTDPLLSDETFDRDGSPAESGISQHGAPAPLATHSRYELLGLIGQGGMGAVYQARHRMMERTVALKIINREIVCKPEAVDRFHREVKTAAQLSHPNIVTAYDAEQAGEVHFLVMEYVDGVDLSRIIKERGALPISEACEYVRQAAIGLQYAHERGMVHRDIKPHNLMVTVDGTVKILDFGLASLAPGASADADTVEVRGDLTAAGAVMGTPDYISPEQAEDARQADIRSDIYSLGSTLYYLLSGRPPFADGSVMHKLKSHAQAEPESLEALRDDIPADLVAVISRMMAKDPNARFQSPEEVAEELHPYVERTALESRQKATSKRNFTTRLCAGFFATVIAVLLFFLAVHKPVSDEQARMKGPEEKAVQVIQTYSGVCSMEPADPENTVGAMKDFPIYSQSDFDEFIRRIPQDLPSKTNPPPKNAEPLLKKPRVDFERNMALAEPELLGHGYTRHGQHILFDGKRIDQEGSHDLKRFARTLQRELKLASNVDAASFKALSEEYTKDKNMVYYKWISPGRFWVVELPEADPKSFESVAFNLAKDHKHVWWYGDVLKGLDPKTLKVVNANFVWKDRDSVWYQHERIADADPKSFTHIGQAYYRDENRVYWGTTPLDGADPKTFRSFGDNVPYGADKNFVWRATEIIPGMDPATFGVVHQSVYKDKTGVYCNGLRIPKASPETTRKFADLNEHLTALLTDGESYFVFVALWNEVYCIEPKADGLRVSREVWEGRTRPEERLGDMSAVLTEQGWQNLKAPESKRWGNNFYEQREAQTLSQHQNEFETAWEIITGREVTVGTSEEFARIMNTPAAGNYAEPKDDDLVLLREYRRTQRKFDGYYRQWLTLHPEIQIQVDNGSPMDVAEVFGAELFGGAESKLSAEDLNDWRAAASTLTQNMFAIQLRRLRPPASETPILREELIRQAAELLRKDDIPEGNDAEDVIDPQIDQWRLHFPEFITLQPDAEKQLRSGQSINEPDERIKAAKMVLEDSGIEISRIAQHLLRKHELNKLTPLQKELLAQVVTAESLAVKAKR